MQCPSPVSIRDPRGTTNAQRLSVPCNKCPICLQNRRSDWSFRLTEELRTATTAHFVTLTYSDENIPEDGTLNPRDLELFHKRLRKRITKMEATYQKTMNVQPTPLKMRYYAVGEYGTETHRPHYHGIYFNVPLKLLTEIEKIWGHGQIHCGTCTPSSIHYTTKYVINDYDWEETDIRQKPFARMSRRPAIGHNYLKRNDLWHIDSEVPKAYVIKDGYKQKMPQYYKNQLFTESEREKIQKHAKLRNGQAWLADYDKEWQKLQPDYIENQFRIIKNQSKSQ